MDKTPFECPGSRTIRQPQPEFIKCPFCSKEVEIWTDEIKATCLKCKKAVVRDQSTTCLELHAFAKERVGEYICLSA